MRSSHDASRDSELIPPEANAPTVAYPWSAPLTSYAIVGEDHPNALHAGRGLSLDAVLGFESDDGRGIEPGEGYDLAVFRGRRVVAVIHRNAGRPSTATRIDGGPSDADA